MKHSEFVNTMEKVYRSFSKEPDTKQMTIYYQFLKFIDKDVFDRCTKQLIETESFFPPIAKFIEIIKNRIEVPSQAEVYRKLSSWVMDMDRDVKTLDHPVLKMMAEETGLCDRFSVEQEDFDNAIKYRYNRIVDEYKMKVVSGEQLRLPINKKRSLYPYASDISKKEESGFKKLDVKLDLKKLKD